MELLRKFPARIPIDILRGEVVGCTPDNVVLQRRLARCAFCGALHEIESDAAHRIPVENGLEKYACECSSETFADVLLLGEPRVLRLPHGEGQGSSIEELTVEVCIYFCQGCFRKHPIVKVGDIFYNATNKVTSKPTCPTCN